MLCLRQMLCALCALFLVCANSGLASAEPAAMTASAVQSDNATPAHAVPGISSFTQSSRAVRLARTCLADHKKCTKNSQCCSGNCQKGTGMRSGTCLHGD